MIVYPLAGKNERLGKLFKTPKHLLLWEGIPAIERSVNYMTDFGPYVILCSLEYENGLRYYNRKVVAPTENVIETLHHGISGNFQQELFIVDCDVIPVHLNKPKGNTVYVFKNKTKKLHYSNYEVRDGEVQTCNEKEQVCEYAGAGVYYFESIGTFFKYANYCKSISDVHRKMLAAKVKIYADAVNTIHRFGTLHDINGL